MPGYDGTGPEGRGAMTGGGRGFCAVALGGGSVRPAGGRAVGRGGRGRRNMYYATGLTGWQRGAYADTRDKESLKAQAQNMERQLAELRQRIVDMENSEN